MTISKKIIFSVLINLLVYHGTWTIHRSELHPTISTLTRLQRQENSLKNQLQTYSRHNLQHSKNNLQHNNNIDLALRIADINVQKAQKDNGITNLLQHQIKVTEENINQLQKLITLEKKHTRAKANIILAKEIQDLKQEVLQA